mmetsp:Transcript_132535/g.264495  ORF Transcript_132535/g.264495 Transcript_132535/m.264495 type:complete len:576 (+) Transcript_132535:56-1783(+)
MGGHEEFDLYDALNLQRDASMEEVRSAFRDLSRIYHPDKHAVGLNSTNDAVVAAEQAFLQVHRAYRVLGDDVLRAFYDRYGLSGIRLAESLSDDEEDLAPGGQVTVAEDRLKLLEDRVLRLMRRNKELRVQRLLGLQGSFTLAAAAGPVPHAAHLRRRYRLQYSAMSHSVQLAVSDKLKANIGCAAHVQGANGAGAAKLMFSTLARLGPLTSLRAAANFSGTFPDVDLSLTRSVTPHCMVQQRVQVSPDGTTFSLTVNPWLTRTLRGSLRLAVGEDPGVTVGLVGRSSTSGHSARSQISFQPGDGELTTQLKYKPSKDFSFKLGPSLSAHGWGLQATCTKAFTDGLTKLHWVIRLRARSVSLRLTFCRCGLRFAFPIELWPEVAGPLPARELGLALLLWTAPPASLRLLQWLTRVGHHAASNFLRASKEDKLGSGARESGEGGFPDVSEMAATAAAMASEQRRLIASEAERRRSEEVARRGLEILAARYGDRNDVALKDSNGGCRVVDVSNSLMARVRHSRLHLSGTSKSTLPGFYNPRGTEGCEDQAPVLYIHYRFGGIEREQTFGDLEPVLLP